MLDSKPKGRGFEPHRRHCVVVLEQDTFILVSTSSTQEDPSRITERLLSGRKESNQTNYLKFTSKFINEHSDQFVWKSWCLTNMTFKSKT